MGKCSVTNRKWKKKTIGQALDIKTDVVAMFVWIPRYEYKIDGTYGKHTDGTTGTQTTPGEIEVKFIPKNKTEADSGYHIPPEFDSYYFLKC